MAKHMERHGMSCGTSAGHRTVHLQRMYGSSILVCHVQDINITTWYELGFYLINRLRIHVWVTRTCP